MNSETKQTPSERFIRLAEKRVKRAIKTLQLIGNLSNRSNYEYTEEEVKRIFDALSSELRRARARFSEAKSAEEEFRL